MHKAVFRLRESPFRGGSCHAPEALPKTAPNNYDAGIATRPDRPGPQRKPQPRSGSSSYWKTLPRRTLRNARDACDRQHAHCCRSRRQRQHSSTHGFCPGTGCARLHCRLFSIILRVPPGFCRRCRERVDGGNTQVSRSGGRISGSALRRVLPERQTRPASGLARDRSREAQPLLPGKAVASNRALPPGHLLTSARSRDASRSLPSSDRRKRRQPGGRVSEWSARPVAVGSRYRKAAIAWRSPATLMNAAIRLHRRMQRSGI